jgi:membrane-bound lytic murein transglycosylase B
VTAIPNALASEFVAAGHAYKIPPAVLAAVASVESDMGANRGPSSAGARGLMQFMPGTAADLGVNPDDDRSSIWGAAKLLNQYGYQRNPSLALSNYNAGPAAKGAARAAGNAYAVKVLGRVDSLATELGGAGAGAKGPSSPAPSSAAPSSDGGTASGGGPGGLGGQVLRATLETVLLCAGAALVYLGARRTLSPAVPA